MRSTNSKEMVFEVLHGIVDCLWIVEELILVFEEALNGLPKRRSEPSILILRLNLVRSQYRLNHEPLELLGKT